MNKYVLMMAAAGLIAAAPAYYAFQAQAEEVPAAPQEAAQTQEEASATQEATPEAREAASKESAAGEPSQKPAPKQPGNE